MKFHVPRPNIFYAAEKRIVFLHRKGHMSGYRSFLGAIAVLLIDELGPLSDAQFRKAEVVEGLIFEQWLHKGVVLNPETLAGIIAQKCARTGIDQRGGVIIKLGDGRWLIVAVAGYSDSVNMYVARSLAKWLLPKYE